MSNIVEQNTPKIFSRINSKGMVAPPAPLRWPETKLLSQSKLQGVTKPKIAPPVPPKSHQAKFAGKLAIFEQNALNKAKSEERANKTPDKQVKQSVKHHPKVEQSGNLHLGWSIPTGNGLSKLNATKKADPTATKQHVGTMKLDDILNPSKKRNRSDPSLSSISSADSQSKASSAQADIDRMTENMNAFEQNPTKSNPATIDDMLFGGVNDPTTCLRPQRSEVPKVKKQVRFELPEQTTKSPTSTKGINYTTICFEPQKSEAVKMKEHVELPEQTTKFPTSTKGINYATICLEPQGSEVPKVKEQVPLELPEQAAKSPVSTKADSPLKHNPEDQGKKRFSTDRFKPRPFLCSDIDGYVAPDKRNPNLEKCSITRSGATLKPLERKSDNNVPPRQQPAENPMHYPTRGNGAKRISKPDVSWIQKPQSKVEGVKVDDAAKKVSRLIAQFEQGGRG